MVVNPRATTTSVATRDVLVNSLRSTFDLEIKVTERRGDAEVLGRSAVETGCDYVVTFGGDGTTSEVVNGLLASGAPLAKLPILCPLPGGSANVFTRALGFSKYPITAIGQAMVAVADNSFQLINLGRANWPQGDRFFTFSLGVGLDAEVIATMEADRQAGKRATPFRYLQTSVKQLIHTEKVEPKITLQTEGGGNVYGVFTLLAQNTRPWTYFGPLAISGSSTASFEGGLDFLAIKHMGLVSTLGLMANLVRGEFVTGENDPVQLKDQDWLRLTTSAPMPMQLDGESYSQVEQVEITCVREALPVLRADVGAAGLR
jgi:diacylglycerol kinase family enzyme